MFGQSQVKILIIGLAFVLPFSLAFAAGDKERKVSGGDESFVKEAAAGGMMEVELGKIAADKASNDRVKQFGRRMQSDHEKVNSELKKIAADKGIEIPAALEGKQKKTVERLSKLSGDEFDREYMKTMLDDHKEDVKKFQRKADKAKDQAIKQFASKQLPILKKHLELARSTEQQVGASKK